MKDLLSRMTRIIVVTTKGGSKTDYCRGAAHAQINTVIEYNVHKNPINNLSRNMRFIILSGVFNA